tara:strand:+ start:1001 stop:1297 length:297 start_codon:yes stop_codon:yes gene_type:complete
MKTFLAPLTVVVPDNTTADDHHEFLCKEIFEARVLDTNETQATNLTSLVEVPDPEETEAEDTEEGLRDLIKDALDYNNNANEILALAYRLTLVSEHRN